MDPTQWGVPYPAVVAALFVIVMARANATYWLGRLGALGAHRTRLAAVMDSPRYLKVTRRVHAYGAPVVTFSFLTVGVQTLVNLAAGASRMPLGRYLPAVTVGSAVWAFLYATLGTLGVDLFGRLHEVSPLLPYLVAAAAVAGIAGFLAFQVRHGERRTG